MLREIIIADLDLVNDVLRNNNYDGARVLQPVLVNKYDNIGNNLGNDVMENIRIIKAELQSLLNSLN